MINIYLYIRPGKEVNAQDTGDVCTKVENLPDCVDADCVKSCVDNFGKGNAQSAYGLCQPPDVCFCIFKC